jgi:hypothetical protein
MTRFVRLPSIEELEEKRLKAADLGHNMAAQEAPAAEAAAVPAAASGQQTVPALHADKAAANAVSQQSNDHVNSKNVQSRTDDEDETQQVDERDEEDSEDRDDNTGNNGATDGATTSPNASESEANDRDNDENQSSESDDNESDDSDGGSSVDDSDDESGDDNETNSDDNESNSAANDAGSNGSDTSNSQTNLTSTLTPTTGNQGTGSATFNNGTDDGSSQKEFSLQVTGLTVNDSPVSGTQEVRVAGVLVGNINLENGMGSLQFSTDTSGGSVAFPANFPTSISSTSSIAVGPVDTPILTGTFGASAGLKSVTATAENSTTSGSQLVASHEGNANDLAGQQAGEDVQSLDAAFESLRAGDLLMPV